MITTESSSPPFVTIASNGRVTVELDAPVSKGGGGRGFGAHDLLEASIAVCINMAVRMYASAHGMALRGVSSRVELSKPDDLTTRFECALHLEGDLSAYERAALIEAARVCPVRQTLSRRIELLPIKELEL